MTQFHAKTRNMYSTRLWTKMNGFPLMNTNAIDSKSAKRKLIITYLISGYGLTEIECRIFRECRRASRRNMRVAQLRTNSIRGLH